ncbi:MAG: signal peptidase I [Candidatus Enteromonas sp.]
MSDLEIISLVITIVSLICFSILFTLFFRYYFHTNIQSVEYGESDSELLESLSEEREKRKSKGRRAAAIAGKTIQYTFVAFLIALLGIEVYSTYSKDPISVNGTSYIVVSTGSMEKRNPKNDYLDTYDLNNQIRTYSLIQVQEYRVEADIALYDVIAFHDSKDNIIIHRIVEIQDVGNGVMGYRTRGDSNEAGDWGALYSSYLTFDDIIGKYTDFNIPYVGLFTIFLRSAMGIVTIVSIVYCLLMFDYYNSKLYRAFDKRTEYLLDVLGVDEIDVEEVPYVERAHLIYKDKEYRFLNGQCIQTLPLSEETKALLKAQKEQEEEEEKASSKDKNDTKPQ